MDVLATIHDYNDLVAGLRARKARLGLANTVLDDLAGFQSGYCGKLLGETQVKKFGPMSLGAMLNALAVKLVLLEDLEAVVRMQDLWEKRDERAVHASGDARIGKTVMQRVFKAVLWEQMRIAREFRQQRLSPQQRSQIARKAADVRWKRARQRSRAARRLALAGEAV